MNTLQEVIEKLQGLQALCKGSFIGAGEEIIMFMRHDLQGLIDKLTDLQNELENNNDRCANSDHSVL